MAAAANSGVDVLFSQFSSVLQDIKLTFVDRQLPLCTADQLTVVRDVTSAVRLSENRLVSFVVEAAMRMERTQKSRMKTASARIAEKIMLKK
jgi:phage antirepressor YoqD-like protein